MINLRKVFIISVFLIPALIIILTLAGILRKTSGIEKRIIAEFSANNEQTEIIKQNLIKMSSDINQSRNLLGLPETDYSFEKPREENTENILKPESDNTVYFRGFEYLKNHYNEVELYRKMSDTASDDLFLNTAAEKNLSVSEKENTYLIKDISTDMLLFTLSPDMINNSIIISSLFSSIDKAVFDDITSEAASEYIKSNTDKVRSLNNIVLENIRKIKNLVSDSIVKTSLKKNSLYLDNYSSGDEKTVLNVKRNSGITVAKIIFNHADMDFNFCSKKYTDFSSLKNDLINIKSVCDIRTPDEKRIEKSRENINLLAEDESFLNYLSDKGFKLSHDVREDNDYFYYDIVSLSGDTIIGSFSIHKVSGEIYLTDHEEVPVSSLNRFDSTSKKKN